jgi:hypothetical protein
MTLGAFKVSDIIINVMSDDQVSCAKQEKFKEQISKISSLLGLDINNKLLSVRNKSTSLTKSENSEVTLEIPYMQSNPINSGAYFPEMAYFNQLYDAVENSYSINGEVI